MFGVVVRALGRAVCQAKPKTLVDWGIFLSAPAARALPHPAHQGRQRWGLVLMGMGEVAVGGLNPCTAAHGTPEDKANRCGWEVGFLSGVAVRALAGPG